ncbi:phage holin family protein [Streptomyces albus subsp. chlorinus]|uniref:phage holin family protein n=1 Tax=Streptomyces albus TaxID=1888 RepID=UPI001570DA57|nr:phage holin family protein [Streptomyces albus]NSC22467.1 phage holin family protein [Streptomyces albus subsp. chlorinus]
MVTTPEAPPREDSRTEALERTTAPRRTEESVGELVKHASAQITELTRQELRLAQAEMRQKGKRFGLGGGMFGAAGLLGFVGLQALAATAIVLLDLVWPLWVAALVVTGILLALAGVLAVLGKAQIGKATPPTPERAVGSVKADVAEIKGRSHR